MSDAPGILAIDVGSSCVKLGWFPATGDCPSDVPRGGLPIAAPSLPVPEDLLQVEHQNRPAAKWTADIDRWLDDMPIGAEPKCLVGSVHRGAGAALEISLKRRRWSRLTFLTSKDLQLMVRVAEPDRVGIDRLLSAVAVNRLRSPDSPAIIVDMGTAITVDAIAADGAFEGGAILAGPMLSLAALHAGTASLPQLDASVLAEPPEAVGKNTADAMASGAFWGAVGAVRELVKRLAGNCTTQPEVFLTGGAAPGFAALVGLADRPARHVPHLVLSGIRLTADHLLSR